MWSLKNMLVSFRVKDQSQAASHSPVYSGVAEAAVKPVVGVRGGVPARCGPLTLWPPFGRSTQIHITINFSFRFDQKLSVLAQRACISSIRREKVTGVKMFEALF